MHNTNISKWWAEFKQTTRISHGSILNLIFNLSRFIFTWRFCFICASHSNAKFCFNALWLLPTDDFILYFLNFWILMCMISIQRPNKEYNCSWIIMEVKHNNILLYVCIRYVVNFIYWIWHYYSNNTIIFIPFFSLEGVNSNFGINNMFKSWII